MLIIVFCSAKHLSVIYMLLLVLKLNIFKFQRVLSADFIKPLARIVAVKMHPKGVSAVCAKITMHLVAVNDYRTYCGEAGEDKMRQRVHGSTDLYGNEKPSYKLLCELQK